MKYIQQNYYNDFNTIRLNALEPRSYFIPFKNKIESNVSLLKKRYSSSKVTVLNGEWDFKFYSNPNDLSNEFDTNNITFDKLTVPSVFEYNGYGRLAYINTNYEFNFNEPHVPTTKPVTNYFSILTGFKKAPKNEYNYLGLYRKIINIEDLDKMYIISFLGVKSCCELYCNGKFVGYFEESHNTSEFYLQDYLVKGENEIVCVVHRWCNGTYLEDQDMFRNTGIFRDVLLRIVDKQDVYDLDYKTTKHDDLYDLSLTVYLHGDSKLNIRCASLNIDKTIDGKLGINTFSFKDLKVEEWNAEYPNLYDLEITTESSYINEKIGFKDIKIINNVYYLNGNKVKFKGVNHHDTNPVTGYTMSPEDIMKDIQNCLDYNINTIRTSHYDCDPLLLELCQEYGIYVVSEVDIETHGCMNAFPFNMSRLSNDKKWKYHYFYRAHYHYNRNKMLKTSIIMWSLGNEAGGGCCLDYEYEYFKKVTDIPVIYESVHGAPKKKMYDISASMYPSVSEFIKVAEKTTNKKYLLNHPYFLIEYAHAMGVGPGNIEGYWEAIYNHDSLIGGCIWEMNDHAVKEKDGSYTYGGDHGEWIHDSNFCVDGLFYPDRTPSTGAKLTKFCYRPIRVKQIDSSHYELFNTMGFRNSNTYKIVAEFSNGTSLEINESIEPLCKKIIEIKVPTIDGDLFINFKVFDLIKNVFVSEEQHIISYKTNNIELEKVSNFPGYFDVVDGLPIINLKDTSITSSDQYNLLYRAQTDNDMFVFVFNLMKPWYDEKTTLIEQNKEDNHIHVKSKIKTNKKTFIVSDEYEAIKDGILVTSTISPLHASGYLPRFAKSFKLDSSFNNVEYFGKDQESYLDMQDHSIIKFNKCLVSDMTEPNIKPQESGNRMHTKYVKVSNNTHSIEFEAVDNMFELGIKPYSDLELTKMKHKNDEIRTGTYVSLSAFQMGIGTGSCGPNTLKEHRYNAKKSYKLKFIIRVK